MKTADEWLNSTYFETQYGREKLNNMLTSYESDWSYEDLFKVIKQIQLDAWKQGMIDAAEAINKCHFTDDPSLMIKRKMNARNSI